MKKIFNLLLVGLILLSATSCKKNPGDLQNDPALLESNKTPTTKGGWSGSERADLVLQTDGSYLAQWHGTFRFSEVTPRVAPYLDGEHVGPMIISEINGQSPSLSEVAGPYFIATVPTWGGNFSQLAANFNTFRTAYEDFIAQKRDANGQLKQASLPVLSDYVSGTDISDPSIITGKVVMWNSSPSQFSIVTFSTLPPTAPAGNPIVLGYYVRNGIEYEIKGHTSANGIYSVTGRDSSNGYAAVTLYGFSGQSSAGSGGNPGQVFGLRVYTSPDVYFDYTGPLQWLD